MTAPDSSLVSAADLPSLLTDVLARLVAIGSLVAKLPLQPAVATQALGAGAAGATTPSAASEAATPSGAPEPPAPQAGLSDPPVLSPRAKLKESRTQAKAAKRVAWEEAKAATAAAKARAKAQARKHANIATIK